MLQIQSNFKLTFLAFAWITGLNSQPSRARGAERKVVAKVNVDSDTIPNGLQKKKFSSLIFKIKVSYQLLIKLSNS